MVRYISLILLIGLAWGQNTFYIELLNERDYPMFIPGRSGQILLDRQKVGVIGEVHPQVLSNWKIEVPVAVWELEVK